jgi:hypothetical protein
MISRTTASNIETPSPLGQDVMRGVNPTKPPERVQSNSGKLGRAMGKSCDVIRTSTQECRREAYEPYE